MNFRLVNFLDVVEDVSGGNIKTKQKAYLASGAFPIVDQGKSLVGGFSDDPSVLCKAELPVVVFGDHTRALKFVDFPFGMGADGVKILRPRPALDAKYLYHYLRSIRLPDGGYDRHFKYLKREQVPLAPLPEQRRIATILDQAETLREHRRTAFAQVLELGAALFRDLFAEHLASGRVLPMSAVVEEFRYGTSAKSGQEGYATLRIPNVIGGAMDLDEMKTVQVTDAELSRLRLRDGDLLFVRTNGNPDYVGRSAVFSSAVVAASGFDSKACIFASYLIRARLKPGVMLPVVLQQYLSSSEGRNALRSRSKTSAGQYNINIEALAAIPVPMLPMKAQEKFARAMAGIDCLAAQQRAAAFQLDALFASLQNRAYSGQL